jgi:hypothetical protein
LKEWNDTGQKKPSSGQEVAVISIRGILLVLRTTIWASAVACLFVTMAASSPVKTCVLAVSDTWTLTTLSSCTESCVIREHGTIELSAERVQISNFNGTVTCSLKKSWKSRPCVVLPALQGHIAGIYSVGIIVTSSQSILTFSFAPDFLRLLRQRMIHKSRVAAITPD